MRVGRWCSKTWLTGLLLPSLLWVAGCHGHPTEPAATHAAKQYTIRGKVVSVDAKDGVISLDSEAIPGFMDAMSMAYTLDDPSVATELHPGDRITAQLQVGARGAVLSGIDIIQQSILNVKPTVQYHIPKVGDTVPDFKFLNQNGRWVHLHQFRGKVVALTFIYTRCAVSDYCPLMSRNFAHLDQMLAQDPKLYARTHLLSVSFDPKYDTPAVLRSYGGAYTGRYTKEKFGHWDFAAPSARELASVLQWFGVGVTPGPGKTTLQHSLSTAVIGPDGRIRAWYPTNTWTPEQLLKDVKRAAGPNATQK